MQRLAKRLTPFFLAGLPVLLSGCPLGVDFWDSRTVSVSIAAGSSPTVDNTQTVNLSDDSAVSKYLNTLSKVEIVEVWVEVEGVTSENAATTASGTLTITDASDSSWTPVVLSYQNVPIQNGSQLKLEATGAQLSAMAALLQQDHQFAVQYQASLDQVPAAFQLIGKIHISATVDT